MTLLDKTFSDGPVHLTLGEKSYPLSFAVYNCELYRQETQKLDLSRRAGKPRLTAEEIRELKARRRELFEETDKLRADNLEANADAMFQIMQDAMEIRRRLDEEASRGDSLFVEAQWFKINSDDPERVVLAAWAGLHQPKNGWNDPSNVEAWEAPLTRHQLRMQIDPSNIEDVIGSLGDALRSYAAKKKPRIATPTPPAIPTLETAPSASPTSGLSSE